VSFKDGLPHQKPDLFSPPANLEEKLLHPIEETPLFPGCNVQGNYSDQKACADGLLLKFIENNLSYPFEAWQDSVQGTAVVSFIVEKDGTVSSAKVVRDPGAGTGAEALRLVNQMNEEDISWKPGKQDGEEVRMRFNLPIKFKLAGGTKITPPPPPPAPPLPPPPASDAGTMWSHPQTMPHPAVCDGLSRKERIDCRNELIKTAIYDNLRWPDTQASVEGVAVISFTVTDTGELKDFKITRDPGADTGKEALRVVKLMAELTAPWRPGTQGLDKKPTTALFHMPVKFKLE
jgi:TonB family protein